MVTQRTQATVTADHAGLRLDRAVVALTDGQISRNRAKQLIEQGKVFVDGRPVRMASRLVAAGATIAWQEAPEPVVERVELKARDILYRDADIVVVNKPSGLLSQVARDRSRDHLIPALRRLGESMGTPFPYLALHHRLDRDTSGVMILACAKRANKALAHAFRDHTAQKVYRGLVGSPPSDAAWEVRNHLGASKAHKGRRASVHAGGDFAHTSFRVLTTARGVTEVEVTLHTGRTHQIRVHLSEAGLPLLGDTLYGGPRHHRGRRYERVMLHAYQLTLPHPITGAELRLVAPSPFSLG